MNFLLHGQQKQYCHGSSVELPDQLFAPRRPKEKTHRPTYPQLDKSDDLDTSKFYSEINTF